MRWHLFDEMLACEPGVSATSVKTFSPTEEFFQDHFPGLPIVPGVLQIEMIAQTGGRCLSRALPHKHPVLGTVAYAKFYQQIAPGDRCLVHITVTKSRENHATVEGWIECNGKKAAAAELLYAFLNRPRVMTGDER